MAPKDDRVSLTLGEAVDAWLERTATPVIPTGIALFDTIIGGGLPVGQVTTILGQTGTGKSELARQFARHAMLQGFPVLHADVELGTHRIVTRFIAQEARVASSNLRERITPEVKAVVDRAKTIGHYTILKGYEMETLEDLKDEVQKRLDPEAKKPTLLIVDSVQRFSDKYKSQDERVRVQQTMRFLENIAHRYDVALVACSEMSRGASGLKAGAESRAIEYVSDLMLELRVTTGNAEAGPPDMLWSRRGTLHILKLRDGRAAPFPDQLVFEAPHWGLHTEKRSKKGEDAPAPTASIPNQEEIVLTRLADGKIHTSNELRNLLGIRRDGAAALLLKMANENSIEQVTRGAKSIGWRLRPRRPKGEKPGRNPEEIDP